MLMEPRPTNYDLNFTVLGIPVRVHPLFWLMGVIFGSGGGGDLVSTLVRIAIWTLVVFISILAHELGHAVAMRGYGMRARIQLYLMGGLAIPESGHRRDTRQQVHISFAGPAAGFMLAGLTLLLARVLGCGIVYGPLFGVVPFWWIDPPPNLPLATLWLPFLGAMLIVNVLWGLINLVPVYPLDGGQIARALLVAHDPREGPRRALWLSVATGAALAVFGLMFRMLFLAFLFGWLAYGSWQMLQRTGRGPGRWHM